MLRTPTMNTGTTSTLKPAQHKTRPWIKRISIGVLVAGTVITVAGCFLAPGLFTGYHPRNNYISQPSQERADMTQVEAAVTHTNPTATHVFAGLTQSGSENVLTVTFALSANEFTSADLDRTLDAIAGAEPSSIDQVQLGVTSSDGNSITLQPLADDLGVEAFEGSGRLFIDWSYLVAQYDT